MVGTRLRICETCQLTAVRILVAASASLLEPLTLRLNTSSPGLTEAVQGMLAVITQAETAPELLESVRASVETMFSVKNEAYDALVS